MSYRIATVCYGYDMVDNSAAEFVLEKIWMNQLTVINSMNWLIDPAPSNLLKSSAQASQRFG